jgi:hypothetical protein
MLGGLLFHARSCLQNMCGWGAILHELMVGYYFPFGAEGIDFLADVTLHLLQIKRLGRPLS